MRIFKGILRWTGRLLLFLIVAGLLWWGVKSLITAHHERQPQGQLDELEAQEASYSFGDFVFTIAREPLTCSLAHKNTPQNIIWSNVPGEGFVHAGFSNPTIAESRGSFLIEDVPKWFTINQGIRNVSAEQDNVLTISGPLSREDDSILFYDCTFTDCKDGTVSLKVTIRGSNRVNRIYFTSSSAQDEHFVGFGEQFSHVDMKGRRLPILCMEQGIGRGKQPLTGIVDLVAKSGGDWHTSYAGVPFYFTNKKHGLYLKSTTYSVFDMRKDDRVQVQVWTHQKGRLELRGTFIHGNSPKALIDQYTSWAGRMPPLPEWTQQGAIVGMQGGTAKVQRIHKALSEAEVPLAGYWLQDWVGQRITTFGKQLWWNWELDRDRYPSWDSLQQTLAQDSIFVLGYVNPFLVDVDEKKNARRNLFKEALAAGYLIQNKAGEPYLIPNTSFSAGLVDLTNPCARDWLKAAIKSEMLSTGIRGWMADFGEALPFDAVLHDSTPAEVYHNQYPEAWAKLNREIVDEDSLSQYMFFSRAGYSKSPRYSTLFWLGDQMVTWDKHDGLKSAVTGLLSGGLSGYTLNHSDIGGYTTLKRGPLAYTRDRELLLRWMEVSAFSALFRSHEGNQPDLNVQTYDDEQTRSHFALTARWFADLAPYRKTLMDEAYETGLPLARHCLIHYPEVDAFWNMDARQFLFGEDLLVAPVMDPGEDEVTVLLPSGSWEHVWSGKVYDVKEGAKEIAISAPMGKPGLFIRKESEWEDRLRKIFL